MRFASNMEIIIYDCVCSSSVAVQPEYTWKEEGFALQYPGRQESRHLENAVARLARRFGQVAIVRLLPKTWGIDQLKHTSVVQSVIPTGSSMNTLVSEGPAYLVGGVGFKKQRDYSVDPLESIAP